MKQKAAITKGQLMDYLRDHYIVEPFHGYAMLYITIPNSARCAVEDTAEKAREEMAKDILGDPFWLEHFSQLLQNQSHEEAT